MCAESHFIPITLCRTHQCVYGGQRVKAAFSSNACKKFNSAVFVAKIGSQRAFLSYASDVVPLVHLDRHKKFKLSFNHPFLKHYILQYIFNHCLVNETIYIMFQVYTIKSYKILQKLSPKHAAHGVAQLTYPIYRHWKACLSKQPPGMQLGTLA